MHETMRNCRLAAILAAAPLLAAGAEPPSAVPLQPLAAIRSLPTTQLAEHPVVRIRGVVTRSRPSSLFVQDDTAGLYVNIARARQRGVMSSAEPPPDVPLGSEVEIVGVADPGGFSPIVLPSEVTVLGPGALPAPRDFDLGRFFTGGDDSRFVECEGIVEEAIDREDHWRLAVRHVFHPFVVAVAKPAFSGDPAGLVDAVVRVRGPTASVANTRGEFLAPVVFVERPEWLEVLRPANASPFESPLVPLPALARFSPRGHDGHIARTEGVVIHAIPGEAVYLQDGSWGLRVVTRSTDTFLPGDRVEAAGFVSRRSAMAELARAEVRKRASGPAPAPFEISPEDVVDLNMEAVARSVNARPGDYQGCLVRFPARLVEYRRHSGGGVLVLDHADTTILARLDGGSLPPDLTVAGSELSVAGILAVAWDIDPLLWPNRGPGDVSLLVRSAADVLLTRRPSPWTPRRLAAILAAAGVALALTLTWAWSLRRERMRLEQMVDERTHELARAREQEKETEERQRLVLQQKLKTSLTASAVAHEINQPLSRLLLTCRLEADRLTQPNAFIETVVGEAERVVTTIEKMKVLLRNVETHHEPIPLAEVLTSSLIQVKRLLADNRIQLDRRGPTEGCLVDGDAVQLQIAVVNLLRNAVEASVTGGGERRRIELALEEEPDVVRLIVGDSGPGWPGGTIDEMLLESTKSEGSGIGLFVITTAVGNHRGRIEVGRSSLGGAEFRITLPRESPDRT